MHAVPGLLKQSWMLWNGLWCLPEEQRYYSWHEEIKNGFSNTWTYSWRPWQCYKVELRKLWNSSQAFEGHISRKQKAAKQLLIFAETCTTFRLLEDLESPFLRPRISLQKLGGQNHGNTRQEYKTEKSGDNSNKGKKSNCNLIQNSSNKIVEKARCIAIRHISGQHPTPRLRLDINGSKGAKFIFDVLPDIINHFSCCEEQWIDGKRE